MARIFGREELKPEDILGMPQDELKKKLDGAATKEDLDAIKAAQEANKSATDEIRTMLKALTTPKPPEKTDDGDADPTVRVLTDPEKFLADGTKDIREKQFYTQARLEELEAKQRHRNIFAQFGEEIIKEAQKFNLQLRAQPNFWDTHIANFVGKKMLSGEIKEGNYPSLLDSSAHEPGAGGDNDPNQGFNPEMASWFKNRGISLEKARKIFDHTIRDGEPMTLAAYTGKQAS